MTAPSADRGEQGHPVFGSGAQVAGHGDDHRCAAARRVHVSSAEPAPSTTPAEAGGTTTTTSAQAQSFTVVEPAYTSTPGAGEGMYLHWAALLRNPTTTHYGALPVITVTTRDAGGQVLATQQQTQRPAPRCRHRLGGAAGGFRRADRLEVTYATVDWYLSQTTPADYPPFTASGIQRTGDAYSRQVVGELTHPFSEAVGSMAVTALYRDGSGKLLTGAAG